MPVFACWRNWRSWASSIKGAVGDWGLVIVFPPRAKNLSFCRQMICLHIDLSLYLSVMHLSPWTVETEVKHDRRGGGEMKSLEIQILQLGDIKLSHLHCSGGSRSKLGNFTSRHHNKDWVIQHGQASSVIPMPAMFPVVCSSRALTAP